MYQFNDISGSLLEVSANKIKIQQGIDSYKAL